MDGWMEEECAWEASMMLIMSSVVAMMIKGPENRHGKVECSGHNPDDNLDGESGDNNGWMGESVLGR